MSARSDIDIVLMDVQMPVMDGFEAAACIKKIEHAKDLPIVFITAVYREDPHIKKGYAVGGVDYFSKPFDPEILKLKVGIYATFRQRATILRDRERQIRVSEELLSAGRRLASILETLPMGVIIADLDGRICQTNEAASRILRSMESMESDSYGQILKWWDTDGRVIKQQNGPLWRALHGGETSRNEFISIRCIDSTEKTILCSASPLRSIGAELLGAVLVIQDVTEPKKFSDDLQERITKLVALGVELGEAREPSA